MIEEPDAQASETSQKPNSSLDHSTISAPSRERCVAQVAAAERKSRTKSRFETASIELGATAANPSSRGHQPAVGGEVHAGQRAGAERQLGRGAEDGLEAPRVAAEHPEVGEQVVREVDGLRALEVRVAGHRPVEVALGDRDEDVCRSCRRSIVPQRVRAGEHRHVGGDLVVARARRVQLAADGADDLGQPPLDGHVDVLVVRRGRRTRGCRALGHAVEAGVQRVAVAIADDPGGREHRRVGARLLDVVRGEPPVEARWRRSAGGRPGPAARRSAT